MLSEIQRELDTARGQLSTFETNLSAITEERDALGSRLRRTTTRLATGVDDDTLADLAHGRYSAAVKDVKEAERPTMSDWWASQATDEARAALPKALRAYLPAADGDEQTPAASRGPGTPPRRPKKAPEHGRTSFGLDDFNSLDADQQKQVASAFYSQARRRV